MKTMKKIVAILAVALLLYSVLPLSVMAAEDTKITFEFGANGSASHADGSEKTTYSETNNGYTLTLSSMSKVYTGARDAKGNSCIKLGTSSAAGKFSFTVPSEVTSVIINVAKYKSNTTKVTINGTTTTLTKNSNDGAYDAITVDTSVTKTVSLTTVSGGYRAMINSIEFVIPAAEGACEHAWTNDCDTDCDLGCGATRTIEHDYEVIETVAATCTETGLTTYECACCGADKEEIIALVPHDFSNGEYCAVCQVEMPLEATITFDSENKMTSSTATEQVFEENSIVVTYSKGSSSNFAINVKPLRVYANTALTVAYPNMAKIVFNANSTDYATALKNSIGAAASVDGKVVTVEFAEPVNDFSIAKMSAQVRLDSLTVYAVKKDEHVCEFVGVQTQAPTCGEDGVMTYTCECGEGTYTESIPATGEHVYFDDCSAICEACGYEREASHNIVHVEAVAPTCDAMGNLEYWYCDSCGMAWLDAECTMNTNLRAVKLPASHTYTDNCDFDCDVCGEYRDAPHTLNTHVEGKEPANCQEEGYKEYWICDDCGGYFASNGMGGYYETNPSWMYYTGDCVRPEGSIPCAVVACTVCGNDVYGEACTRPENAPVCQDAECVYCGEIVWGWGCNYNTGDEEIPAPLCQPGDCVYCGTHYEKLYDCENGSWAPCSYEGECAYGCGKQYPATGEHEVENPCEGGMCWLCWEEIEGTGHVYTDAFDTTCNVCDAERAVVAPVIDVKKSISEDVNGLAFCFEADVAGFAVKAGTFVQADYTNATYKGYKLIETGVTATNGAATIEIKGERMFSLDENGKALFAYRIINIPADKLDVEITMTPYYIVEIDGEIVTIEGDAVVGAYAEVAIS